MNKALLFFGAIIIFIGILFFYLLISSVIDLGRSVTDQYSTLPEVGKNQINTSALISAVIILIGTLIVREAFKR